MESELSGNAAQSCRAGIRLRHKTESWKELWRESSRQCELNFCGGWVHTGPKSAEKGPRGSSWNSLCPPSLWEGGTKTRQGSPAMSPTHLTHLEVRTKEFNARESQLVKQTPSRPRRCACLTCTVGEVECAIGPKGWWTIPGQSHRKLWWRPSAGPHLTLQNGNAVDASRKFDAFSAFGPQLIQNKLSVFPNRTQELLFIVLHCEMLHSAAHLNLSADKTH